VNCGWGSKSWVAMNWLPKILLPQYKPFMTISRELLTGIADLKLTDLLVVSETEEVDHSTHFMDKTARFLKMQNFRNFDSIYCLLFRFQSILILWGFCPEIVKIDFLKSFARGCRQFYETLYIKMIKKNKA
jgi:hypothetical protein